MHVRRMFAVAVLGVALVVAMWAFVSAGIRLQTSPASHAASSRPTPEVTAPPALLTFERVQTANERAEAGMIGLPPPEVASARDIGLIEGLHALVWRDLDLNVCEALIREGLSPGFVTSCIRASDFAADGVAVHWTDSPDVGPFDVIWAPNGEALVRGSADLIRPSPSP